MISLTLQILVYRKIAAWNIITASIVCILFVVYIFVDCNHNAIAGSTTSGKLMQPFCSKQCICDQTVRFTPVCPIDSVQTFYSPCHAGCSSETVLNGQRVSQLVDQMKIVTTGHHCFSVNEKSFCAWVEYAPVVTFHFTFLKQFCLNDKTFRLVETYRVCVSYVQRKC